MGAGNKVDVIVVVSGQPFPIEVNTNQRLAQLIKEALKGSGNAGQAASEWELRTEDGRLLDQDSKVEEAGITGGMTLFLNPKAGIGG